MAASASPASTYVRKIEGGYEYGFVRRSANFRKTADTYTPAGVEATVAKAEACRAALPSSAAVEWRG